MVMLTQSERLALLLNLLGDETAAQVRSGLQGQRLAEIEVALNDFEKVPPSVEEIDFVLDDFQRYFTMAMETISADELENCLLYTSPSPRDQRGSRMPSSA